MPTVTQAERVTLYFRGGGSDKVYHAAIEPGGTGFVVNVAYGRRGGRLQTSIKTPAPVDHAQARRIFDQLVRQKTAKGYTPGQDGRPYQHSDKQDRSTGIVPQLLNPVTEADADRLVADDRWWLQEKFHGRRLLIRKRGAEVVGINRAGLLVGLPKPVVEAVQQLAAGSCLLDGEAVGDAYHVFDVLDHQGVDLRPSPYALRYEHGMDLADAVPSDHLRYADTATTVAAKRAMLERLRRANREGAVFKDRGAPFTPGRPASGGTQLKLKFTATALCVVARANGDRRSVRLELAGDAGNTVCVGSVTIPPGQAIPAAGQVVEVRYLYAFPGGGSLYQPVYLGRRDDVPAADCRVAQLKLKPAGDDDAEG